MLDDLDAPQTFPSCPPGNPVTQAEDGMPDAVLAGDSVVLRCGDQSIIIPGRWILKGSPLIRRGDRSSINMLDLTLFVGQIEVADNNRDDIRVTTAEICVPGSRTRERESALPGDQR